MALASLDSGLFSKIFDNIGIPRGISLMSVMVGGHVYAVYKQSTKGQKVVIALGFTVQEPECETACGSHSNFVIIIKDAVAHRADGIMLYAVTVTAMSSTPQPAYVRHVCGVLKSSGRGPAIEYSM